MMKLLCRHVVTETTARRFVWAVGFLILAACTALVLKALPDFGVAASVGLVAAVAFAWVVVGALLPRMANSKPLATANGGV